MDNKFDQLSIPPRAKNITKLSRIPKSPKQISSNSVTLMSKNNNNYYFKQYENPLLAQLDAYCGTLCQFLATSEYVPNTRLYHNSNGKYGVAAKEIVDFQSNHENPLQIKDLVINSSGIHAEYLKRSAQLITQNLLEFYNYRLSTMQQRPSYLEVYSWFNSSPEKSTRSCLLQFIKTADQWSVQTILDTLNKRKSQLCLLSDKSIDSLTELNLIKKVIREITALSSIASIEHKEISIKLLEQFDKIIKKKHINIKNSDEFITEVIDGIEYTLRTQDLKNYRILKGLGVCLSTRYIFKEGDNNNSNFSKDGQFFDFGWTKADILFQFKTPDAINSLLRNPKDVAFAFNEYNIEHFPDVLEPNLFYWPTKQPKVHEQLLNNLLQQLDQLKIDIFKNDNLYNHIPLKLVISLFEAFENTFSIRKTYKEIAERYLKNINFYINSLRDNRPPEELIIREKTTYLFDNLSDKIKQLIIHLDMDNEPFEVKNINNILNSFEGYIGQFFDLYFVLRSALKSSIPQLKSELGINSLNGEKIEPLLQISDELFDKMKNNMEALRIEIKRRCNSFDKNSFTVEDNINYKLLASNPVFIFHKYKTFLKYILTDVEVYQNFAKLNISKENLGSLLIFTLVNDEMDRIHELKKTIIKMPDFKQFLVENGNFAFELIKEEFLFLKAKYAKKAHYPLVQALDIEKIESKFKELCSICLDEEELALQNNTDTVITFYT